MTYDYALLNSPVSTSFVFDAPASPSTLHKCALSFILSEPLGFDNFALDFSTPPRPIVKRKRTAKATAAAASGQARRTKAARSSESATSPQTSACKSTDAPKKSSKFCVVDGCMSRAKHAKRCWRHGGSVKCKVAECDNRAKSKGVCWSHGGGTLCSFESCDTISVSNGFCWAHGGGKRCAVHQCSKPAYERTQNYCTSHFEELCSAKHAHAHAHAH